MDWNDITARKPENTDFPQPDAGMHQAVCVFVNNIGTHKSEYQGKTIYKKQVVISWEIDQKISGGESDGKPFMVSKFYTLSLHEKAELRKDLEAWRGRQFGEDELSGFDLKNLIGANCYLNLVETDRGKRKIASIMPIKKTDAKLSPTMDKPSPNFQAWIDRLRADSEEMKGNIQQHSMAATSDLDEIPF